MGDEVKKFTSNPIKTVATGFGAMAGNPVGIMGMIGGGKAGSKVGGAVTGQGSRIDVPDATGRPGWVLSDPQGKLRSDLMLNGEMPKAAGQSQDVLNTMIARSTAAGPSDQAKYLQDANQRTMMNSLDNANATSASGQAGAIRNMAMRGGVDAGSRERLGRSFGAENLMNRQRIMNDARGADLNILAQDEQNKTAMMSALPGQLLAQAGFEQDGRRFDIANTLQTVGGKYGEDMRGWAANQAAREQAKLANKKDGIFGLGLGGIL